MSRTRSRAVIGLMLVTLSGSSAFGCPRQAVTIIGPTRLLVTQDDQGFKIVPLAERGAPCCTSVPPVSLGVGLKLDAAIFERSGLKSEGDTNAPRR